jgi:hypothetical protein
MGKAAIKKKHPSKEQVKAWLGTVIGPMTDALSVEIDRLATQSLSFRVGLRDFEFLWPTARMVAAPFLQNRLQYFRTAPTIERDSERHDDELTSLRNDCTKAFDVLSGLSAFIQLVEANAVEPMYRPYLAEHIVNGVSDLPQDYVHHKLWTTHGQELLSLRDSAELKVHFARIRKHSASLYKIAKELHAELQEQQLDLADEFGLPAVDPDMRGMA